MRPVRSELVSSGNSLFCGNLQGRFRNFVGRESAFCRGFLTSFGVHGPNYPATRTGKSCRRCRDGYRASSEPKLGRTPGVLHLQLGEDGRAESKKPNARWRRLELRLMRYTRAVGLAGSWSAPRAAMAAVPAGETFPHQHITDAVAIHPHDAEQAAIAVSVMIDRSERDRPVVQKLLEPQSRPIPKRLFAGTSRVMRFGSVDIGNPDLRTAEPDRIAVDHAVVPTAGEAEREARSQSAPRSDHLSLARCDPSPRSNDSRLGRGDCRGCAE